MEIVVRSPISPLLLLLLPPTDDAVVSYFLSPRVSSAVHWRLFGPSAKFRCQVAGPLGAQGRL